MRCRPTFVTQVQAKITGAVLAQSGSIQRGQTIARALSVLDCENVWSKEFREEASRPWATLLREDVSAIRVVVMQSWASVLIVCNAKSGYWQRFYDVVFVLARAQCSVIVGICCVCTASWFHAQPVQVKLGMGLLTGLWEGYSLPLGVMDARGLTTIWRHFCEAFEDTFARLSTAPSHALLRGLTTRHSNAGERWAKPPQILQRELLCHARVRALSFCISVLYSVCHVRLASQVYCKCSLLLRSFCFGF